VTRRLPHSRRSLLSAGGLLAALWDAAAPAKAPVPAPDVAGAIRRGVDYLVASQNKDGSWGSPASNLWDIYAPVPGSFTTFGVAVTALSTSALLEAAADEPKALAAVERARTWLLANHGKAKRITADVLYNVWAQAYAIEAFCRLLDREKDPARQKDLRDAIATDVDLLRRFEFVDGGWGYYNFDVVVQQPEHGATSFTTATVLVALAAAKARGVAVPERLVSRGLSLIETCRKPDWAFAYSWEHRFSPQGRINKTKGSLARTPVCMDAYAAWGKAVPPESVAQALDDLERYGHFLLIARKYPIPHEAWYQNSGYFCFYGYYYASILVGHAPEEGRAKWNAQIAAKLVPIQEKDGSWWDYQLYSYHKPYGTAYVLMALAYGRRGDAAPAK
jgi:hypothetical protein